MYSQLSINVTKYTHVKYGTVYGIQHSFNGPSSYEQIYRCIATDWHDEQGMQIKQTRVYYDLKTRRNISSRYQTPTEQSDEKTWWQQVTQVGACRAPRSCPIPAFFTPEWIAQHMKYKLEFVPPKSQWNTQFRIHRYRHSQLGTVYRISDTGIADAPTPWYDTTGKQVFSSYTPGWDRPSAAQIAIQKQWNTNTRHECICRI
jgi:hypothetical protein